MMPAWELLSARDRSYFCSHLGNFGLPHGAQMEIAEEAYRCVFKIVAKYQPKGAWPKTAEQRQETYAATGSPMPGPALEKRMIIYKYDYAPTIEMPEGAKVLRVDDQHGTTRIWAEVDLSHPLQKRYFDIYGTGQELSGLQKTFINTFFVSGKNYVLHAYEILQEA